MKIDKSAASSWRKNILRPYKVYPASTSVIFGMLFNVALNSEGYAATHDRIYVLYGVFLGLTKSIALYLLLKITSLVQRISRSPAGGRAIYFLGVSLASLVASAIGHRDNFFDLTLFLYLRNTLSLLLFCGVMGKLRERREIEVLELSNTRDRLQTERGLLLEAEERIRRDVADLLHDRVQSDLIVTAMTLEQLAKDLPEDDASRIRSVVEVLEDIRTREIRMLSRKLTPNLEIVSLKSALAELAESYGPVFSADVEIDSATEEFLFTKQELSLALYRVVEQGVQNATVHGKATRALLRISRQGDEVQLLLSNNGAPLNPEAERVGSGLSIIRAWVEAANGGFSLLNLPQGGVQLEARFDLSNLPYVGVIPQ